MSIDIVGLLIVLAIILVSMMLHELAHGWVAYWLGDTTAKEEGRLSLNPMVHLDPIMSLALPMLLFLAGGPIFGGAKPVPINTRNLKGGAWGMALVALAGPLTNFILAFVGFLIGHFTGVLYGGGIGTTVFLEFVMVNLGFGVFNLIPIPPLDGSRVLYALSPDPIRDFLDVLEQYGMIMVLLLVVFGSTFVSSLMSGAMSGILRGFYWIVGG